MIKGKCQYCGKPVPNFFCCKEHSYLWDEKTYPNKKCLVCGSQLYHDGLTIKQYEKTNFCSRKCASIWHTNHSHTKTGNFIEYIPTSEEVIIGEVNREGNHIYIIKNNNHYYWVHPYKKNKTLKSHTFSNVEQVYADMALAF